MIVPDANIFIYAADIGAPQHTLAKTWLEKALGGTHQGVIGIRIVLAQALVQLGKFAEAEAVAQDLLAAVRKAFGDKSSIVESALVAVAVPAQMQGRLADAETVLREALGISKQLTPDGENANVAAVLLQLATVKAAQGASRSETELLRTEAANIARKLPASAVRSVEGACDMMFEVLMKFDKHAEAEPIQRVLMAYVRQVGDGESEELAWRLTTLTWVLNLNGKYEEGEAVAREAEEMRLKLLPYHDWRIYAAEFSIAESLLGRKKYAEAEAVLLALPANLKRQGPAGDSPFYGFWKNLFKYDAEKLHQLYTETNQPAKAAEWKKKADDFAAAEAAGN